MKLQLLLGLAIAALVGALAFAAATADVVNTTCPISGQPVDGSRTVAHGEHAIAVCCERCEASVAAWTDAQKDAYVARLTGQDAKAKAAPEKKDEPAPYLVPDLLVTCPITGRGLGEEPVEVELKASEDAPARKVRVCCGRCKAKAEKDPAGTLKKVDELTAAQQRPLYPLDTCVVMEGEPLELEGEDIAVEVVVGNRLFRVCCEGCVGKVRKDPAKYAALLDAAAMEKQRAEYPLDHCVVMTDHVFAEDEEVTEIVVAGRLVRVCCWKCEAAVWGDPRKFVGAIDAAR